MDIRKVKKLIELLDESGIAEIEITEGEESVRISRVSRTAQPAQFAPAYPPPAPAVPAPAVPAAQGAAPAEPAVEPEEDGYAVTAPMVGTFYSASSPGSPAFVQVGDRVKQGDVLCIVEAMKMMNQIEAEVAGTIKAVRVQNGEPVEYGQVLFIIDQRGSA
jgi:acetyl-CoA carboxylase biotin carboxyl carrier protein